MKGYDATAVREICEAAGITKPTLYHFFGSKDGVLQALVHTGFQQYRATGERRDGHARLVRRPRESAGAIGVPERQHANRCSGASYTASSGRRPGTALPQTESCTQFYDGVVGVLAAAADKAVARGEIAPGPTTCPDADPDGIDWRGGDRLRHCRQARADARAGGRNSRNDFQRMAMTDSVMRTALHSSRQAFVVLFTGVASAQPLSRADAVAQALASNPTVKLSLEQVALLEGRIVEAKADALPDITWNTLAMRSRDPGSVEQPELRRVSAGVSRRAAPVARRTRFRRRPTSARRSSASSWARRSKRRAWRATRATRTCSGRGSRRRWTRFARTTSCCSRSSSCASFARTCSRSRRTSTTRAIGARREWPPSSRCFAPRSISRMRAPKQLRAENEVVRRARVVEHRDAAPDQRRPSTPPTRSRSCRLRPSSTPR